jgi:sulfite reductase beta subunit-like hemoprotein
MESPDRKSRRPMGSGPAPNGARVKADKEGSELPPGEHRPCPPPDSLRAVVEEIARFEADAQRVTRGELSEDQFRPLRLKHGIYGQRQPGLQMVRVKIPAGVLSAGQLRLLAEIARRYASGRGHFTTRENCQFHHVPIRHVPEIMRRLAAAGLTTREACGNVVRTITACPLSGVCGEEAFDVAPYALALTHFLLRHPEFQELPRKFKIAFSGCEDDGRCALAAIHDVGLIARLRLVNSVPTRGFQVLVGGGLGSLPTAALPLTDFLPAADLLPTIVAILRVFAQHGDRANKHKARLKFVLRAQGIERFRELVAAQRERIAASSEAAGWPVIAIGGENQPPAPAARSAAPPVVAAPQVGGGSGPSRSNGARREIGGSVAHFRAAAQGPAGSSSAADFPLWAEHNLRPQRQPGIWLAWIQLPAGNISAEQMAGLADLMAAQQLDTVRVAVAQDLVIPWIRRDQIHAVYSGLHALGLAAPGAQTIADVTGCPGATTCNLGITRSMSLAEVLTREFAAESDPEIQRIRVKISGCPNSCGHHHVADIGLFGNARRIGDRLVPYYQLLLGGAVLPGGVRFAHPVAVLPARRVPRALRLLLDVYRRQRAPGESFATWAARTPQEAVREHLRDCLAVTSPEPELFTDWGDTEPYSLQLGRGECAV